MEREAGAAPIELIVLQGTPFCNLNCTYCDLSAVSRRQKYRMPVETVERVFREIFGSGVPVAPEVTVIWHSGEPLTLDPAYYDACIDRILATAEDTPVTIRFDIQTNAVMIDDAWCDFFVRHAGHLQVGVSCDGPAAMHDAFRVNWGARASHARTVRGMDALARRGIRYKAIAVVTERTLADPENFFDFFARRRHELRGFHFNILAEADGSEADLRYTAADHERYYRFYRRLLDLCREREDDAFVIDNFTQGLARILDGAGAHAESSTAPLKSLNVDARGNVTTFYAGLSVETEPGLYGDGRGLGLGNIHETGLAAMAEAPKLARMRADFAASRAACEAACPYHAICPGGFELTKLARHGRFDADETPECVVHVKALADALLDDVDAHLAARRREAAHA